MTEGWTLVFDLDAQPSHSIKKQDIGPALIKYAEEIRQRSKLMCNAVDRVHHKPAN